MIALRHGRVSIALHLLRERPGPALLCLHGLGGAGTEFAGAAPSWPGGPVYALDFSGHGRSGPLRGGGYHPELLAGDADAALAHIGPTRLVGVGVGAYVALLVAGARPDAVAGALLLPGAGLAGGGPDPDPEADTHARWTERGPALPDCDPAVRRLENDVRPPDYAMGFAQAARRVLLGEDGGPRPPWWVEIRASASAVRAPAELARALAQLAEEATAD